MEICEFHIVKLKGSDGNYIDVPVIFIRGPDGKIRKKISYKQYKRNYRRLPALRLSPELESIFKKRVEKKS